MCGYTLDEVDSLIKGSKTVVGGETVAQMVCTIQPFIHTFKWYCSLLKKHSDSIA